MAKPTKSKEEIVRLLQERIELGAEIINAETKTEVDLTILLEEKHNWDRYNRDLILRLFGQGKYYSEYCPGIAFGASPYWLISEKIVFHKKEIYHKIVLLESFIERLGLLNDTPDSDDINSNTPDNKPMIKVFIVHGHDEELKKTTEAFLRQLGLEPIILEQQPNLGKTLIEKYEDNSDVAFAVVLFSPDDYSESVKKVDSDDEPRFKRVPRQNVVLELGYFMGKISRSKVCILFREGTDMPSDLQGVVYIKYEIGGDWQMKLAKELKATGIPVDIDKLLG